VTGGGMIGRARPRWRWEKFTRRQAASRKCEFSGNSHNKNSMGNSAKVASRGYWNVPLANWPQVLRPSWPCSPPPASISSSPILSPQPLRGVRITAGIGACGRGGGVSADEQGNPSDNRRRIFRSGCTGQPCAARARWAIGSRIISARRTSGARTVDGQATLSPRHGPRDRQRRASPRALVRLRPRPSWFYARSCHRSLARRDNDRGWALQGAIVLRRQPVRKRRFLKPQLFNKLRELNAAPSIG